MFGEKDSDVKAIFNYREGTLQITGEGAVKGGPLPWSASQANVKVNTVEIGDKITKIGTQAFAGLNDVTSVTIGNAVNIIASYAFQDCSKLTNLELRNVTEIGNYAFSNCSSLESVSKSELGAWSLGENAFSNCSRLKAVNSKELFAVSGNTFKDCNEALILTWYEWQQPTIPYYKISYGFKDKTLKLLYEDGYIGERDYQLSNDNRPSWNRDSFNVNIQNIVIGEGIKRIGNEAFKGMSRIENVSISNSITNIGDGAFEECINLTKIEIPNQVKTIGNNAFSGGNIGELVIPNSVTMLKMGAFSRNPIQIVEFKGTDCHISDNVFEGCNLLTTVKMHKGANHVNQQAFGSDNTNNFKIEWKDGEINVVFHNQIKTLMVTAPEGNNNYQMEDWYTATSSRYPPWSKRNFELDIKHIGIGERIQNVGLQSFYGLDKVQSVEISDTVKIIDSYAFANCSSLENIKIPYSVDSLGMEAFSGCTKLSKVEIYNPEMTFKTDVFKNFDKEKLLMRGYEDSTAHEYARKNNIKFEPFDWKYCRVEFYYDGTIDDSLTWKYQVIELNELINENSEIIQKAKQRGQKNGFKYNRFETQLGEMSKNNVIKVYYTKDNSMNPDPGGKDPNPTPGGKDPSPGGTNQGGTSSGGNTPGSNNPGGNSNSNGNGSNGGASSSTGTSSKGNGKSITGSPSDSLASKIIPKTGLEVGLLVGIITLSGVAVVCYKKSKWN